MIPILVKGFEKTAELCDFFFRKVSKQKEKKNPISRTKKPIGIIIEKLEIFNEKLPVIIEVKSREVEEPRKPPETVLLSLSGRNVAGVE